jgi:hypothetical protein
MRENRRPSEGLKTLCRADWPAESTQIQARHLWRGLHPRRTGGDTSPMQSYCLRCLVQAAGDAEACPTCGEPDLAA